jgi:hypothetical protein
LARLDVGWLEQNSSYQTNSLGSLWWFCIEIRLRANEEAPGEQLRFSLLSQSGSLPNTATSCDRSCCCMLPREAALARRRKFSTRGCIQASEKPPSLVGETVAHPERYYQVNVVGTLSLLEGTRLAGVSRFIFYSSAAATESQRRCPSPTRRRFVRPISMVPATARIWYVSAFGSPILPRPGPCLLSRRY